jgi:hypothetical protein
MNVIDLDGNKAKLKLTGHTVGIQTRTKRSKYHLHARELLQQSHPTLQILEEVSVPIRRGTTLYLDFFLPLINLCIEVHGEQHYKFIPFFHKTKLDYLRQLGRDRDKEEWCGINDIDFVILKYDEMDNWDEQL